MQPYTHACEYALNEYEYVYVCISVCASSYKMDKPEHAHAQTCCPSLFSIVIAFLTLGSIHAPQG